MADEKSNEDQGFEEIEEPIQELNEESLDHVSGGLQPPSTYVGEFVMKNSGNLVNLDKKVQVGDLPFNKTVKP